MRDAERLQVRDDGNGRIEIKIRGELQAVSRDRYCRRHFFIRCARTPPKGEKAAHPPSTRCPRSEFPQFRRTQGRARDPTSSPGGAILCRRPCASAPVGCGVPALGAVSPTGPRRTSPGRTRQCLHLTLGTILSIFFFSLLLW